MVKLIKIKKVFILFLFLKEEEEEEEEEANNITCLLRPYSTLAEHLTHNPNVNGSKPNWQQRENEKKNWQVVSAQTAMKNKDYLQ